MYYLGNLFKKIGVDLEFKIVHSNDWQKKTKKKLKTYKLFRFNETSETSVTTLHCKKTVKVNWK